MNETPIVATTENAKTTSGERDLGRPRELN
jgi:hypothetical protein